LAVATGQVSAFPVGSLVRVRERDWVVLPSDDADKRHVRPAARELGISLGGWHDFRHTLSTKLRRAGVHPRVVSDILGHSKVNLAMEVYDRTELADFAEPLSIVSTELLRNVTKSPKPAEAVLQIKEMVSAEGIEPSTY
jgi:hypothetical protein